MQPVICDLRPDKVLKPFFLLIKYPAMRIFLFIVALASVNCLHAQTREIAFKSHSGNMANFSDAATHHFFGTDNADFGLPENPITQFLDSVIYISETKTLLVIRQYNRRYNEPLDSMRFQFVRHDTVYRDPLYSQVHSLDSIRQVLKAQGWYKNKVRSIVFVGYDNKKPKKNAVKTNQETPQPPQQNSTAIVSQGSNGNDDNTPFDSQVYLTAGIIILLSLSGAWISWKLYQPRLQQA